MHVFPNVRSAPSLQNWFLYFFGAAFNIVGLLLVVAIGRQPLASMFSGLSQVGVSSSGKHAAASSNVFPASAVARSSRNKVCFRKVHKISLLFTVGKT